MKFLNKIENDKFDVTNGHKHDGVDSPVIDFSNLSNKPTFDVPVYGVANFESMDRVYSSGDYYFNDIAWNGTDKYIIAGSDGLYTSSNGLELTKLTALSGTTMKAVAYGNGTWVAISNSNVYYSTDGETWISCYSGISNVLRLKYMNDKFIASDYTDIFFSSDGINWTKTGTGYYVYYREFIYVNGTYYFVGSKNSGTLKHVILMTTDLVNVTAIELDTTCGDGLYNIIYVFDKFYLNFDNKLYTTTDFSTFNLVFTNNITSERAQKLVFLNGVLMWLGGTTRVYCSTDGVNFTNEPMQYGTTAYNGLFEFTFYYT